MRIWEYIKDKAGILIGYLLFIAVMLIAFRAMRTPGGADGDLSCADSFASGNCHINRLYKTQTFL